MELTGLYIIVAGALVSVSSFIGAAANMARGFKSFGEGNVGGIGGVFAGHLGAMVGMIIGGFISFVGVITLIISAVNHYG